LFMSFVVGPLELRFFGVAHDSPYLFHWSLALGLVDVAIAGYVTSWTSKSWKLLNAAIFGGIEVLLGIAGAMYLSTYVLIPLWFNVASSILIVPASVFGAYIAASYKLKSLSIYQLK